MPVRPDSEAPENKAALARRSTSPAIPAIVSGVVPDSAAGRDTRPAASATAPADTSAAMNRA